MKKGNTDGYQEYFYYIRDESKRPIVTVCLFMEPDDSKKVVARGLAVCNPKDAPRKKTGQNIARGHGLQALAKGKSTHLVPNVSRQWSNPCAGSFSLFSKAYYMGELNPELTDREKRIVSAASRVSDKEVQ